MVKKTIEISAYEIRLTKGRTFSCGGQPVGVQAMIKCIGIPSLYSDEHWRAYLYFSNEGTLPAAAINQEERSVRIFLPGWQYERFVDLLRNEKPIFCDLDEDRPDEAVFRTSLEPVGEEESSG